MNKLVVALVGLLAFSLQTFTVLAEVNPKYLNEAVSVKWQDQERYRDVEAASNDIQKRYQQRVFDSLERYLHKELPKAIASDQKIEITVYNLDLAGDVLPFVLDHRDIRVVKSIYPPMIDIEYKLLASDGTVIKTARKKFRDIGFEAGVHSAYRNDPLHYEKAMLKKWIRKELKS